MCETHWRANGPCANGRMRISRGGKRTFYLPNQTNKNDFYINLLSITVMKIIIQLSIMGSHNKTSVSIMGEFTQSQCFINTCTLIGCKMGITLTQPLSKVDNYHSIWLWRLHCTRVTVCVRRNTVVFNLEFTQFYKGFGC